MNLTKDGIYLKVNTLLREITGEKLYLTAFILYICDQTLQTTMWEIPWIPMTVIRYLALLMVMVKIICYDDHGTGDILLFAFFVMTGVMIKISSGENVALFYLIFLYGAREVEFDKILKVWLICSCTIISITVIGSCIGTVIDLQYKTIGYMRAANEEESVIRHSMGVIYPTDFAAHVFGILMVMLYLIREKIKIWHCLVCLFPVYWLYRITYARNNAACMSLLCTGYTFICLCNIFRNSLDSKYRVNRVLPHALFYAMPLCAVISFVMNYNYHEENDSILNKLMSSRLIFGNRGLSMYPPNLFGHHIIMQGGGRSTRGFDDSYFFIDCSYLYTGLRLGMIFLLIIIIASVVACYRQRNDAFFVLTIICISIFGIFEHHIEALEYMPFLLGAAASVGGRAAVGIRKRGIQQAYGNEYAE